MLSYHVWRMSVTRIDLFTQTPVDTNTVPVYMDVIQIWEPFVY